MRVEYLDDLPFLADQINRCDLSNLLDVHFPDHGHWKGISGGKVALGWLLYILSEADHRLSHVEDWAELRLHSLGAILEEPYLRRLDFCDDRLARLLDRYSDDRLWVDFEQAIGRELLQVYRLDSDEDQSTAQLRIVRTDSFNAPQYRDQSALFRHGYSKQRRSDQPFCKVMVSALDPSAIPLAVDIVKGSGPDVDHYLPVIERVQSVLKNKGNLYVGDSQLCSMPNRSAIHRAGDYYLCPLSKKQVLTEQLDHYIAQIKVTVNKLPGIFTEPQSKRKPAYFYELKQTVKDQQNNIQWQERRILVYSPLYAQGLLKSLNNRLDQAEEKIQNLVIHKKGRRKPKTLKDLHARVDRIIKQYKVEHCFEVNSNQVIEKITVKKYKDRPEEIREKITLQLSIKRSKTHIELKRKRLAWQLYATNIPEQKMEAANLVKSYRDEYRIEHLFDYLINRETLLLPIFLKKEQRVKGLIRLLSLAMRFSMLIQYQARKQLAKNGDQLKGIYPGNKNRKTNAPTTPMLLRAFRGMAVVWLQTEKNNSVEITPLKEHQKTILNRLGMDNVYQHILDILKAHPNLRET